VELAGAAGAGRGRKGGNLQRGERRSQWLITDTVVAGRWSWQHVVVLVAQDGAGGRDVDGEERKKKKKIYSGEKEERKERRETRCLLVQEKGLCGGVDGGRPVMVVVVAKGHGGERKKKEDCAEKKTGDEAGFFFILDPNFSSLRPSNPPLFIGSGRGQYFLHWRKIAALDSDGKDPNRWLKVGMVHCQIVKSAAVGCLSWPLWGGATSIYLPFSR
jgi:hypothetical protein